MCDFAVKTDEIIRDFNITRAALDDMFAPVADKFGAFVDHDNSGLAIPVAGRPLTRVIATHFDAYAMAKTAHSSAV